MHILKDDRVRSISVMMIALVVTICTGFMFTPGNTKALPTAHTGAAMTGSISRITASDINKLTPRPLYSSKDVTCLARNIYFEARNESIFGQHMVAWTTLNRVKDERWKDTVCGVVYERKQFSWTIKYSKNKAYNRTAYRRAVLIAKDTLHDFHTGGTDLSKGALYYHADYVDPTWDFSKLTKLAQVDTHIFYKDF